MADWLKCFVNVKCSYELWREYSQINGPVERETEDVWGIWSHVFALILCLGITARWPSRCALRGRFITHVDFCGRSYLDDDCRSAEETGAGRQHTQVTAFTELLWKQQWSLFGRLCLRFFCQRWIEEYRRLWRSQHRRWSRFERICGFVFHQTTTNARIAAAMTMRDTWLHTQTSKQTHLKHGNQKWKPLFFLYHFH